MDRHEYELLGKAFTFAAEAHAEHTRKGNDIPYLSHLLQVSGLVLSYGGTPEFAAVGLLHDTVEDCAGVSVSSLEEMFGASIAGRVASLTDLLPGDEPDQKGSWLDRKQHYLAKLKGADAGTRLVAACDKLDNLRSLIADIEEHGVETLGRFTGSPAQTRWYYEEVRNVIASDLPAALLREIDRLLASLKRSVPVASAEG
ncbi:MAG: bifunctional (p)ppGpp synthetase/guanosine-3',5'-bis(diphosphate) 3'-pyrophosphohydrolase [Deltaproteobacteria bacterium]|nr:bifunctional (p)ppGpp synthetase/guanosine-3',5'-bis(diphosphate) 3'-pyrophosphohydrolase [Deltaproteobacteria bacterium]